MCALRTGRIKSFDWHENSAKLARMERRERRISRLIFLAPDPNPGTSPALPRGPHAGRFSPTQPLGRTRVRRGELAESWPRRRTLAFLPKPSVNLRLDAAIWRGRLGLARGMWQGARGHMLHTHLHLPPVQSHLTLVW